MQFDFGENWNNFSKNALTKEEVEAAKNDFLKLVGNIDLNNRYFLDIGFGQGLSILTANHAGAICTGCDINPKCGEVLKLNKQNFFSEKDKKIDVHIGSILDENVLENLRKSGKSNGKFDIVHSWGVLHHTGNMKKAIENTSSFVEKDGLFILAIYNKHWSSLLWLIIKKLYNKSPGFIKWFMIKFFYVIIALAKFIVTRKNPFRQVRGMNFYYDVIDWIGGYPYEYASKNEIQKLVEETGFVLLNFNIPPTPTGCVEYVFQKKNEINFSFN